MTEPSPSGSAPPRLQRGSGIVRARFAAPDPGQPPAASRLLDLYQTAPGRALLPRPEPGEPAALVLLTTSGGLTGGDRMEVQVQLDAGASVTVLAQAAEKIYRAADADAETRLEQVMVAEDQAWAEWLPQETILFQGARFHRSTEIRLSGGARLLAGDLLVFGRVARGEHWRHGALHDRWDLRRDGRLVWTERQSLEGDIAGQIEAAAGFGGAAVQGTILFAAPEARDETLLARLREAMADPEVRTGATLLGETLLVRLLSPQTRSAREAFARAWTFLRQTAGWPATMPRLWLR